MAFSDVSVSVSGLRERLLAVWAGVRPLARVNPHVHVQLVLVDEALAAARARVRLVARVVALVHLQLGQAAVRAAALGALVAGPLLHVLPAVAPQPAAELEALAAVRAAVGFLRRVDVDVQPEAGGGREAAAADGAQVRPLPRVQAQVLLQLVLVEERASAEGAVERLLALVRRQVLRQLAQRGEGGVAARARERPLPLELLVLEAVALQLVLGLEGLHAAAALVRPLGGVRLQVILERGEVQEDAVAVRTSVLPSLVDLQVALVVRQLAEELLAQGAEVLSAPVALLMLLQGVLHLELLPADAAGVRLFVNLQVRLQFLWTAESLAAFGTRPVVFAHVNLQVSVEVFWEGEDLVTVGTPVAVAAGCFPMRGHVSLQVIQSTERFAAVAAHEAARTRLDLLVQFEVAEQRRLLGELSVAGQTREAVHGVALPVRSELQEAAEALPTLGADVLSGVVLDPQVSGHVVGLTEGGAAVRAAEGLLLGVRPHVSGQFVRSFKASVHTDGTEMSLWLLLRRNFPSSSILGFGLDVFLVFRL